MPKLPCGLTNRDGEVEYTCTYPDGHGPVKVDGALYDHGDPDRGYWWAITQGGTWRTKDRSKPKSEIEEAADRLEKALDPSFRDGWTRLSGTQEVKDFRLVIASAREQSKFKYEVEVAKKALADWERLKKRKKGS